MWRSKFCVGPNFYDQPLFRVLPIYYVIYSFIAEPIGINVFCAFLFRFRELESASRLLFRSFLNILTKSLPYKRIMQVVYYKFR